MPLTAAVVPFVLLSKEMVVVGEEEEEEEEASVLLPLVQLAVKFPPHVVVF